jgi:squalene cyclase
MDNILKMIGFLLVTQANDGGWPYVNDGPNSTLSTGHSLSSLILSSRYISDKTLQKKVSTAIEKGLIWIESNQNDDGGWGVQPSLANEGKLTRISSTYYALRPYWSKNITYYNSSVVKNAVDLLLGLQNQDGGWPFIQGEKKDNISDVSNTSRALLALIRSGYDFPTPDIIEKGINFLIYKKLKGTSWKLGVENFSSAIPAVTLYHNNSPCDALEALVCANYFGKATREAFAWLLNSQRQDGFWELTSPDPDQHDLERAWTWSTTEFVHVINLVSEKYLKFEVDQLVNEALQINVYD